MNNEPSFLENILSPDALALRMARAIAARAKRTEAIANLEEKIHRAEKRTQTAKDNGHAADEQKANEDIFRLTQDALKLEEQKKGYLESIKACQESGANLDYRVTPNTNAGSILNSHFSEAAAFKEQSLAYVGATPLLLAILNRDPEVVSLLLSHSNPNARNQVEVHPLMLALERCADSVAEKIVLALVKDDRLELDPSRDMRPKNADFVISNMKMNGKTEEALLLEHCLSMLSRQSDVISIPGSRQHPAVNALGNLMQATV